MTDDRSQQKDQGLSSLSVDPDLLARELAAEDDVDPLDAIQLDDAEQDSGPADADTNNDDDGAWE